MGSLKNSLRRYGSGGRRGMPGFVPVGDALCHTNPMFALGLSQSLIHAFALATALADASRLEDVPEAYHPAVESEAAERFALATECDQARGRWWRGEPVDFFHRSGARQLFLLAAGGATALGDPDISAPTSAGSGSSTARPSWTTTSPSSSAWRFASPSSAPRGRLPLAPPATSCWPDFLRLPEPAQARFARLRASCTDPAPRRP